MNTTIQSHDHVAHLGRAVVALPTAHSLEQVTRWHMLRFWQSLARTITIPHHGPRRACHS